MYVYFVASGIWVPVYLSAGLHGNQLLGGRERVCQRAVRERRDVRGRRERLHVPVRPRLHWNTLPTVTAK